MKLKEAIRKIERLESEEIEPVIISSDDPKKIEELMQENRQLKQRVEQLDNKVKMEFTQSLDRPSPVKEVQIESPEKDEMIKELSQQI